jgi:hypothetical protein
MLGPGLRAVNCPTDTHGPNDGHTETRAQSRTVRRTILPCERGIRHVVLALVGRLQSYRLSLSVPLAAIQSFAKDYYDS